MRQRNELVTLLTFSGAVLLLAASAGTAQAQTVIVQRAEPGSSVEVTLNGTPMATGAVQPGGDATVRMTVADRPDRWQATVAVVVDACGATRRVHFVERDRATAPPAGACARDQIEGYFLLQSITSMLVDVGSDPPTLRLRQGRMPSAWLSGDSSASDAPVDQRSIYVFGGGGFRNIQPPIDRACGITSFCEGSATGLAFTGGAGFWFVPYFAVQADYTHVPAFDITGGGANYDFTGTFGADLLTLSGVFGVPLAGHYRPYGRVGAARHRATTTTSQTNLPTELDLGSTQEYGFETEGWGWLVAGGMEVWPVGWFSFYGEMAWTYLRGESTDAIEFTTDDRLILGLFGVRVRLGP